MLSSLLLAVSLSASPPPAPSCPPSVVRVIQEGTAPGFDRKDDGGSGVCVLCRDGKTLIVTNRHVVDHKDNPLYVYSVTGWWGKAELVKYADQGDLAVLMVEKELPCAELAPKHKAGTPLTLWGYPYGCNGPKYKTGHAMADMGESIWGGSVVPSTIRSEDGFSGGGEFTPDGKLMCLADTSAGSCIPASEIKKLIEVYKEKR